MRVRRAALRGRGMAGSCARRTAGPHGGNTHACPALPACPALSPQTLPVGTSHGASWTGWRASCPPCPRPSWKTWRHWRRWARWVMAQVGGCAGVPCAGWAWRRQGAPRPITSQGTRPPCSAASRSRSHTIHSPPCTPLPRPPPTARRLARAGGADVSSHAQAGAAADDRAAVGGAAEPRRWRRRRRAAAGGAVMSPRTATLLAYTAGRYTSASAGRRCGCQAGALLRRAAGRTPPPTTAGRRPSGSTPGIERWRGGCAQSKSGPPRLRRNPPLARPAAAAAAASPPPPPPAPARRWCPPRAGGGTCGSSARLRGAQAGGAEVRSGRAALLRLRARCQLQPSTHLDKMGRTHGRT